MCTCARTLGCNSAQDCYVYLGMHYIGPFLFCNLFCCIVGETGVILTSFQFFWSFLPHIEAMTKDFFIIVKLNICLINYAVSQILNVNSF